MNNNYPQLPENWKIMTLGEVSIAQSGTGFPKIFQGQKSGDLPFIKVRDISFAAMENNSILNTASNYVSKENAEKLRAKLFPTNTTLFAKIGEAIKLNRRVLNIIPVCADNNVMGLIPKDRINEKYLFFFMQTINLS